MNEAQTRAELIDPALQKSGWGVISGAKILREVQITNGKIEGFGQNARGFIADYVLVYKNQKLAVIEAKKISLAVAEGVAQAKIYAQKLGLELAFACNGKEIYQIKMAGENKGEGLINAFPTPDELWEAVFGKKERASSIAQNTWRTRFLAVPPEIAGNKTPRYYQILAVNSALNAVAEDKTRLLLTLATGTGKTFIAFQIAWALFQTRWNLNKDALRRPRILFLADRNLLADQAFNGFSAFPTDALARISPKEITKKGGVPTNGSIFFTIFQTFMSGQSGEDENAPYFGDYPANFFDFIIVDECHRGGANDEGSWRAILDYFSPAVQLGLTATPKRKDNADTYRYFGEPIYTYSLKEGVNDGFLTPFRVRRIKTTIDDYIYTPDDLVLEGEVDPKKNYAEGDFNRHIFIKEREQFRVKTLLEGIPENEKTLVFCATQQHAGEIRDLINQMRGDKNKQEDPHFCVRVTANDGLIGEQFLREFQDNDKTIPTILTTSQKLSTGVDAKNVRHIVLLRKVNSMIEFKQIIGRGTRLFTGKFYFTIHDFVDAHQHFADPEWDGEPIAPDAPEVCDKCGQSPCACQKPTAETCQICAQNPCICAKKPCQICGKNPCECPPKTRLKIKLGDGKEREIQKMEATSFWDASGTPISTTQFVQNLYGTLPLFFKDEDELRRIWQAPNTRKKLLEALSEQGYGTKALLELQKLVQAEKSDLFDVLEYIAFAITPILRSTRVENAKAPIFAGLTAHQRDFLEFVLFKYIDHGVDELAQSKLPELISLKYQSITEASELLGGAENLNALFGSFQKHLYANENRA